MKKNISSTTSLILVPIFLLTYFLDLTGLMLHQVLGIAAAIIAILHLILHWQWVKNCSQKLFSKLSSRIRIYYAIDAILLLGLFGITLSGVLISTWVETGYRYYPFLRTIHITTSIISLVFLLIKLAIHWRFFAHQIKRVTKMSRASTNRIDSPVLEKQTQKMYSRREAMAVIGSVSLVGAFGFKRAFSAIYPEKIPQLPDPKVNISTAEDLNVQAQDGKEIASSTENDSIQGRKRKRGNIENSSLNEPTSLETEVIPQTDFAISPEKAPSPQDCIIRCPEGCAFPGICRRYIDENNNQLCDLGECI